MISAKAIKSFRSERLGRRIMADEQFYAPELYVRDLARNGLVEAPANKMLPGAPNNKSGNLPAAGSEARSSASPAAQVSQQTTVAQSSGGVSHAKRTKRDASSSSTPVTGSLLSETSSTPATLHGGGNT